MVEMAAAGTRSGGKITEAQTGSVTFDTKPAFPLSTQDLA
jgi:hypothetical protein